MAVGVAVGAVVGAAVGALVGAFVGDTVGAIVGAMVGDAVIATHTLPWARNPTLHSSAQLSGAPCWPFVV